MEDIIEKLLRLGHEVTIIRVEPIINVGIEDSSGGGITVPEEIKTDKPKKRKKYTKKNPNGNPPSLLTQEIVDNIKKKKRVNWKTIKEIKKLKEEGYTSKRVSDKLLVDLEVINKYWDKE